MRQIELNLLVRAGSYGSDILLLTARTFEVSTQCWFESIKGSSDFQSVISGMIRSEYDQTDALPLR